MAGKPSTRDYAPVGQTEDGYNDGADASEPKPRPHPLEASKRSYKAFAISFLTALILVLAIALVLGDGTLFGLRSGGLRHQEAAYCPCRPSDVPQYFQTSPELWAGPTPTGKAAFLAQTRTFNPTATYVPNAPLQTSIPIEGMGSGNKSIFELMG